MASITNPYAVSPIGDALARLGQTLTSGPTQAQRIKGAEEALALKREREGITSVADLFGSPELDRAALARAGVMGGLDPSVVSGYDLYRTANDFGARAPETDAAARGDGQAFSGTAMAFDQAQAGLDRRAANSLAEQARQFDMTPTEAWVGDQSVFVPRAGAFDEGVSPMVSDSDMQGHLLGRNFDRLGELDPAQQNALGAQPTTGSVFTVVTPDGPVMSTDGVHDTFGNPLPPGSYRGNVTGTAEDVMRPTTANVTLFQRKAIELDTTLSLLDATSAALADLPEWGLGVSGDMNALVVGAGNAAANIAEGMGFDGPQEAVAAIEQQLAADAARKGEEPRLLSREIRTDRSALDTLYILTTYSVAGSLFGQEGRGLSNEDVKKTEVALGTPQSFFQNKQTLLGKLGVVRGQVQSQHDRYTNALGLLTDGSAPGLAPAAPPAPVSAPAPAAQPAPVGNAFGSGFEPSQQGAAAGFDPAGAPRQIGTEQEYNALPPGAEYIDPNGVRRRKGQ